MLSHFIFLYIWASMHKNIEISCNFYSKRKQIFVQFLQDCSLYRSQPRQSAINTQDIHNSVSTLAPSWWWCRYSAQRTCWSAPPTWSSTSPLMTPSGWWCRYWTNSRRAFTSDLPINFLRSLLRKLKWIWPKFPLSRVALP